MQITEIIRSLKTITAPTLLSLVLIGCDSSSESVSAPVAGNTGTQTQPQNSTAQTQPQNSTVQTQTQDSGDCAFLLTSNITSPTQLANTSSSCDYELEGRVAVRSLLVIDPGVVIRAKADAVLVIDGGQIQAIGTAENRIVLEGASHVQGFWRGIDINEGRTTVFDYVDIKDAGQECTSLFCPDVGFFVDDIEFSFTNSSVSNSYVIGMSITEDVSLQRFSNNRFYGNGLVGLSVDNTHIPMLDVFTDYGGVNANNGIIGVGLHSGDQTRGEVFRWKKLNAPYYISSFLNIEGGILRLDPGVQIVFDEDAWLDIDGNGTLQALGTAQEPIIFRGQREQAGYWDGISFDDSPWTDNILQYVTISHSGSTENLASRFGAISLDESRVRLINTTFTDNERWAIRCNDPDFPRDPSIVVIEGDNRFANNGSGNVDSNCEIR